MAVGDYAYRSKNLKEIMKLFCPSVKSPFILLASLESEEAIVRSGWLLFHRVHLSKQRGWRLKRMTPFSVRTNQKQLSDR